MKKPHEHIRKIKNERKTKFTVYCVYDSCTWEMVYEDESFEDPIEDRVDVLEKKVKDLELSRCTHP